MIFKNLKAAIKFCIPDLDFTTKYVFSRSLSFVGAMLLLCVGVEINIIKLIVRWRSNLMLQYIHT